MPRVKFIEVGKFKQSWDVTTSRTDLETITRLARARKSVVPAGVAVEPTMEGQGVLNYRNKVIGFYQVVP